MNDCRDCRLRRRSGRLCPEHFHDFLGWLLVTELESLYWAAYRQRHMFIDTFVNGAEDIVRTVTSLLAALDGRTAAA